MFVTVPQVTLAQAVLSLWEQTQVVVPGWQISFWLGQVQPPVPPLPTTPPPPTTPPLPLTPPLPATPPAPVVTPPVPIAPPVPVVRPPVPIAPSVPLPPDPAPPSTTGTQVIAESMSVAETVLPAETPTALTLPVATWQ